MYSDTLSIHYMYSDIKIPYAQSTSLKYARNSLALFSFIL